MNLAKRELKSSGLTLVEVIFYLLVVGVLIFSFFEFFNSVLVSFNKKEVQREVLSENYFLINKIGTIIINAKSIIEPQASSSEIALESYDPQKNPTKIYLDSENLLIREGNNPSQVLNSNRVKIDNLNFQIIKNNTKPVSIKISLTSSFINESGRSEFNFSLANSISFSLRK